MTNSPRQPAIVLGRGVGPGNSFGPATLVTAGVTLLVTGMDAYPTVQPNNGDLIVTDVGLNAVLWQIQQSQNFPGPFAWRGEIPLNVLDQIQVTATVGFNFLMWGVWVPDFTVDVQLPD